MSDHYVGEVVRFRPRVTGGEVVAVVTGVYSNPLFGVTLDIRITDGTRFWPTGVTESISADILT